MTTNRDKIIAKIRALRAKTADNGCTEEEAMSAAIKAAELIQEYQIDLTETEIVAEGFEQVCFPWDSQKSYFVRRNLAMFIARYTDTKVWMDKVHRQKFTITFFGLKSDVMFAGWLSSFLVDFVCRAADEFIEAWVNLVAGQSGSTPEAIRKAMRPKLNKMWEDFAIGAAVRIGECLKGVKTETRVKSETGTALVVMDKQSLIAAELGRRNFKLGKSKKGREKVTNGGAYYAGREAGDRAGLNRPVGGDDSAVKIGAR